MNQARSWTRLVEMVRRTRNHEARFYKPVCLIAAIDLANEGGMDPMSVEADAIMDRFGDYVRPHFRDRARLGWQPLWYLSGDGIWSFLKEGRLTGPRYMKGRYQPRTRRTVREQFDQMIIDPAVRPEWQSAQGRQALRNALLLMLWQDHELSSKVFARALFEPRNNEAIDLWPTEAEMSAFHRRFYGEQDLFERTDPPERAELSLDADAIQRLRQDPLGAQFDPHDENLVIRASVATEDAEVSARALTAQLHAEVRRKVGAFAAQARRLDNTPGWSGIGGLCDRLSALLERPTRDVPEVIGLIYSATLELGSFLEFDNELRQVTGATDDPLDPRTRRGLDDVVRTLAPWIRLFPTAQQADDSTSQFLALAPLTPTAEATVEMARVSGILRDGDATVLRGLLDAARRGESIGDKAGARGVLSTRNMVVVLACAVGGFYGNAIASDFATKSILVHRAGTFLATAEAQVLALVEGLPADLRLAVHSLIRLAPRNVAAPLELPSQDPPEHFRDQPSSRPARSPPG